MRKSILAATAAAFALAAFPAISSAQVIGPLAPTAPIVSVTTELTSHVGPNSQVLEFAQFNPTLGTLLSVTFTGQASIDSVVTVTNSAATPSNGTVFTQSQFTFEVPDFTNLLVFNVDTNIFGYALDPGQSTVSDPALTGTDNDAMNTSNAGILAQFTGFGTINIGVATFTQTFLANNGGNTSASQNTQASATGTVTYNYLETGDVPEPGTWAMLAGMGGIGARFVIRRRRK